MTFSGGAAHEACQEIGQLASALTEDGTKMREATIGRTQRRLDAARYFFAATLLI